MGPEKIPSKKSPEITPDDIPTEEIIIPLPEDEVSTNNSPGRKEAPSDSVARLTFNLSGIKATDGDKFKEEISSLKTPTEHDIDRINFKRIVTDALKGEKHLYLTRFRDKIDLFIGEHPDEVRNTAIALGGLLLLTGGVVYRLTRKIEKKD